MTRRSIDNTETDLVKVAHAHDQVGAEFLQGLLEDVEIPSLVRRAPGFDVPDFMAAGPRDILVAVHDAELAREVLQMDDPETTSSPASPITAMPSRVLASLLLGVALVAGVVCVAVDVLA